MALNDNIVIKLKADTTDYTTKLQAASAKAQQFNQSLNSSASTSSKITGVLGRLAIGAGAVATAIGVDAVRRFADFDQAMSGVKANVTTNTSELDKLKAAALDAGARTIYNATESANAITELGKAGVSTKDILAGGLNGSLALAAAGEMGVADAAELTASTLNQFALSGNQATHVADLLAAGANLAQGGVQDMGEALKNVGVNAHNLGMSVEETVGSLTLFASKGLVGSEAGVKFNSMLQNMVAPSHNAQKQMDELGLTMYDQQGRFVGITNFAQQLHDKLSKLPEAQRNAAMGTMFSNAALTTANILYEEGGKGVAKYTKMVNQNGFAQKQAAALTGNLKGDVEQLSGAWETSMIKIGEGANGPLRSIVQALTNVITNFSNLPPAVQQATVGVTAAVGGFAALDKMMTSFTAGGGAVAQTFNSLINPVQRLRDAAPALKAGFGDMVSSLTGFGSGISSMSGSATRGEKALSGLKNMGSGVVSLLGGPWGIALAAAAGAVAIFAQRQTDAKNRTDDLKTALQSGQSATEKLTENLKKNNDVDWGWVQSAGSGFNTLNDALKHYGISSETFVKAVQGNKKAIKEFNDALNPDKVSAFEQGGVRELQTKLHQQQEAYQKAKKAAEEDAAADKQASASKTAAALATAGLTKATGDNTLASSQAATANDILKTSFGASSDAASDEGKSLNEVIKALQTYYGFAISADQADDDLEKSMRDAGDAAKKYGRNIHSATAAGEAERGALQSLAQQAYKTAQAHAKNGDSVDKIRKQFEQSRAAFISNAEAMGMSASQAEALAKRYGLTSDALNDLIANARKSGNIKINVTDNATKAFNNIKLKVKTLPNGKVEITGNNKDAIKAIAAVNGMKIGKKQGSLTLNKKQYDIALALANGAKINKKTGALYCDNSKYWQGVAKANGWKIDKKTGVISGNNGPFMIAKRAVENTRIADKTVSVKANTTSFFKSISSITDRIFNTVVDVTTRNKKANGGLVLGPGSGTSDSIPAMLSNGEYVMTAEATRRLGLGFLNRLNYQRYAQGGLVTQAPNRQQITITQPDNTSMVDEIASLRRDMAYMLDAMSNMTISVDGREFGRTVRRYA